MFKNQLKIGLPLRARIEKSLWSGLSSKEKVPDEAVNKEGHADSLRHERAYCY